MALGGGVFTPSSCPGSRSLGLPGGTEAPLGIARARACHDPRGQAHGCRRRHALRARGDFPHPPRLADRGVDRARGRAHGARHRRLPQRELRQRAGADRRALRRRREPARRRARLARGERDLESAPRVRRSPRSPAPTEHGSTAARCSSSSGSSERRSSPSHFPLHSATQARLSDSSVVAASVPVAIVLLLLYLAVVGRNLRRHREHDREREEPGEGTWSLRDCARRSRRGDRRDGLGERDPRPLAERLRGRPSA